MKSVTSNIIKITVVGLLVTLGLESFGQSDIAATTHWYNRASFNPASIVREGYVYFFSTIRNQWAGFEGAPKVYNVQASGFSDRFNSAFGISFVRDEIGLSVATNPILQYAYSVKLKNEINLALGMSAGFYLREINGNEFDAEVIDDPTLHYYNERFISPDANIGAELQGRHFIAGVSLTHLFSIWKSDDLFLISSHRYAYALYRSSDSELYNFTAGIQVSNRRNLTVVEGTGIMRIKRPTGLIKGPTELFDFGLSIRSVKQATLIAGINITSNLRLGYTYDINYSNTVNGKGTFEVLLEYRIPLELSKNTGFKWYD